MSSGCVARGDIEVILVTYHSRELVDELLRSLPGDLAVAVIDNASGADGVQVLVKGRPNGRYVDGGGVGFARAANLGARTSRHRFLIFVNPDTRPTIEQLTALADDLATDDTLAAVAATTVSTDGRVELGTGGWEPTLRRACVHASGAYAKFPRAGIYARPRPSEPIELDWLTGACLAVPRQRFVGLGGFDERYFLYNEDMAYGRRLRDGGFAQRLRTDLLVPHSGAGSGGAKAVMLQMRGASMMSYLSHHNTAPSAQAMRLVLSAGAAVRWIVFRHRGRRDDSDGFVAYLRGLWRGSPDM